MKKYKTIDSWISDALSDQDKGAPCTAMALVYRKPTGGTREIHGVKLEGRTWEPETLAKLVIGKAEAFSQDLPGIQNFEVQAFYGKSEPEAMHPFVVLDGELQSGGAARVPRETADGPGIIAQAMKHAESAYGLLSQAMQGYAAMSVSREERMDKRIQTLELEVTDSYKIIRDMMMDQMKVNHEFRMKELEYERSSAERKKMLEMMPALANTASGKELFPQETADTALIDSIADKVDPAAIDQLLKMGLLPQEVAGPLSARLAQATEKKKREREELKKLPPVNSDPRQDAQGN